MPINDVAINLRGRQFIRHRNGTIYLILTLAEIRSLVDEDPHVAIKINGEWCVPLTERIVG